MLNLSNAEEILAILIAVAIIIGFVLSTYKEIQSTIAEEKAKQMKKKETEAKVETLIQYLDAKRKLIDAVNQATKKSEKSKG
tara:strand:- start:323 stop:568 length:246 start_codon:yes stop_codon:yes gene_type:complete